MSIIFYVAGMFLLTFLVSMFVAFIIKLIYSTITSRALNKYSDPQLMEEYNRALRIQKIRTKRIINNFREAEKRNNLDIINYYYGKRKDNKILDNSKTNEIVEYFYESK